MSLFLQINYDPSRIFIARTIILVENSSILKHFAVSGILIVYKVEFFKESRVIKLIILIVLADLPHRVG